MGEVKPSGTVAPPCWAGRRGTGSNIWRWFYFNEEEESESFSP